MHLFRLLRNRAIGSTRRTLAPIIAWRASRIPPTVALATVRRRLELVLAAMYDRPLSVGPLAPHTHDAAASPHDITLPAFLDARAGVPQATKQYRLLAIEQAERMARGTDTDPLPADVLVRDLYLLAEGAAIDRVIAERAPGLVGALTALRQKELSARLPVDRVPPAERDVELLLQSLLAQAPDGTDGSVVRTATPDESHAWARDEAARLRMRVPAAAHYAGVRALRLWGVNAASRLGQLPTQANQTTLFGDNRTASAARVSSKGQQQSDERKDGKTEGAPTRAGTGASTAAPGSAEDRAPPDAANGGSASAHAGHAEDWRAAPGGIVYREWDEYAARYRPDEVTVRASVARETDDGWAVDVLRTHAPLVRQIRARFAPLRAHRTRLRAQRVGDELDLDECVAALVEMRRGRVPSERLYRLTRPARRTLAIMLLVDVSGSTKAPVADGRSVLDVERMTLLLASEALDELGDPYAVLAFSGSGRHDVQVDTVKSFADHDPAAVRRRMSALVALRNTRLGAALRHATALLNAQRAERRLLLLLSDGQPNDVGGYQGPYGVGDSRRAVLEARACGVHPFCLTVDREEHEYLPQLFGASGYRILREPKQLPAALLQVVTQLLPV